jgi:hypothetical protein
LDELAEVLQIELWHHNKLETGVQALMNQAREAYSGLVNDDLDK